MPTEAPHSAKIGDRPFKLLVTCTVENDKPLATPLQNDILADRN